MTRIFITKTIKAIVRIINFTSYKYAFSYTEIDPIKINGYLYITMTRLLKKIIFDSLFVKG